MPQPPASPPRLSRSCQREPRWARVLLFIGIYCALFLQQRLCTKEGVEINWLRRPWSNKFLSEGTRRGRLSYRCHRRQHPSCHPRDRVDSRTSCRLTEFSGGTNMNSDDEDHKNDAADIGITRIKNISHERESVEDPGRMQLDNSDVMRYEFLPTNSTEASEAQKRDYDCYFSSYAYLYHQKEMLQDFNRMEAYYDAINKAKSFINGKKVLDVGAGSGILSIWAAKAGAEKVWSVEYTNMAQYATKLCKANTQGIENKIEVVQASAEQAPVPTRVDVIVSEWMGMFLLRESMLDSLIRVRDRLLKPDGIMLPSHADMFWGLAKANDEDSRLQQEMNEAILAWKPFAENVMDEFGVDFRALTTDYIEEQHEYYLGHSRWVQLDESDMATDAARIKHIDTKTVSLDEAKGVEQTRFRLVAQRDVNATGFVGWFTVDFNYGKPFVPESEREDGLSREKSEDGNDDLDEDDPGFVQLSTSPNAGKTHWGQQYFPLRRHLPLKAGDVVEGTFEMFRSNQTHRTYKVRAKWNTVDETSERFQNNASEKIDDINDRVDRREKYEHFAEWSIE